MKEIRLISSVKVRNACVEHNWFTCGSQEEYEIFLEYIYKLNLETRNITTNRLEHVAKKIKQYSDTEYDVAAIMFVLANDCCKSYFI